MEETKKNEHLHNKEITFSVGIFTINLALFRLHLIVLISIIYDLSFRLLVMFCETILVH